MSSALGSQLSLTVETIVIALEPAGAVTLACRRCGVALDLHQPEPDDPDLMLGTCLECGAWFAIRVEGISALIVTLPMVDLMRQAMDPVGVSAG